MSSFSIDIFNESDKQQSLSDSNTMPNSSFNPTFNSSIGSSSNRMDFRPTSTSISAPDLLPLNNDSTDARFKQNQLINGKTQFEQSNTIIKSLEEEIVTMKHKLSFVYEKDEEISKLKDENMKYKKEISELKVSSEEVVKLRLENNQLNDLISENRKQLNHLVTENTELKQQNSNLSKQIESSSNSLKILEKDEVNIDNKVESNKVESNKVESNKVEEIEEIEELIDINVHHLRNVLFTRLKEKQMHHIEGLINSYGLKRTNKIKKSVMEKMLEEAIHL